MTAAESASASGPTPTTDKVKVAIRVRPFSRREIDLDTKCVVEVKNDQTILHYSPLPLAQTASKQIGTGSNVNPTQQASQPGNQAPSPQQQQQQQQSQPNTGSYRPPKVFTFDNCFWSFDRDDAHYASQEQVFQELGVSILDSAFQGYNACIFAYGQTGSGKSYTMMGTPHDRGLIPRLCDSIFDRMHKVMEEDPNSSFKLEVSYMEIYNEKVHDLLVPANERHSLKVREHNILGPYVDGLSTLAVSSFEEINNLMAEGNKSRTVASTNMNSESSRSHAVFTLTLTCSIYDPVAKVVGEKVSKMSLVDLAGSERAIKTGAVGERLKEGSNINKSLTTLGLVISKLADQASGRNRKEQFVPYRDSVLTWLLKDNLGGNSKTIMISTISPSADSYEETLSTLRYADRAKRIVNHAVINEDPNNRIIRELREEVEQLREQLMHATVNTGLQERLVESEKLIREMEQTWEEKLRKTEKIHQERQQALEKMGISVQSSGIAVEKDRYYLVNLNADPSMNALLVYYLKPCTLIGRPDSSVEQDIQLSGVGIMPEHAIIEIDKKLNQLWMTPVNSSAITFVNGVRIYERSRLHNMDRILWGNNHFFSLNCPATPNQHMPAPIDNFFDYNYARDEMLTSNNPDLKAMFALDPMDRPTTIMNRSMDGSLSGSTTYLPGIQASRPLVNGSRASSSANLFQSPHQQPFQQRMLEKLAQEREENFRLYLSKLREDIAKANTLAFEANLIAEEMRKQTEFKVTLQIPATNLNPNRLKRGVFVSEPAILVKRKNFPQQIWSMEKFDTNLIEMREQYAEWKERQNYKNQQSTTVKNGEAGGDTMMVPSSPNGIQLRNDPFYELQERHLLIGVANIFLEVLMQDVQLDYQVPIISQQGEMVGRLHVEFGRVQGDFGERIADAASSDGDNDDNGSNDGSQSTGSSVDQNHHSAQLVMEVKPGANKQPELSSNQIRVRLQIKSARGLPPELSNFVFCQYTVCGLTDMIVLTPVDTTDHNQPMLESSFGSNTTTSTGTDEPINFHHQREFIITLTEEFRELCTDGALSIEVWGHRISANPKISLKSESEQQISKISRTLADRWLELKRKLDLWVEIHELNDQGSYTPVEIQHQPDILTGGIYQLRQGQQRRIVVRVETVADTGTLPFLFESIRYIQVGCVCVRSKMQKSLDSYQEGDLSLLNERWSTVLQKRQSYLQEQINELMNKKDSQKTQEEIEREHRLMNQWVSLVEERKASKCPASGSEIPGAPDDRWEPSTGMEDHVPVIFLDLNTDELNLGNSVGKDTVAGGDLILPKEYNGTPFFNLSITSRQSSMDGVQAVAVWDSSVHESVHLNRITASNERIFLILKVCVHLSHPANMDLILRKRIAINVFKKQGLVSSTKNIFKRISRADLNPNGTGIRYEIVASIPKASEDIEDRESLALLAASDVDLTACDGESYIERYTKSVSALESVLMLDRLRQEVAVREQIAKKAKRALQLLSAATANQNATNDCDGQISSELRKTLSVPNMAQFVGHYKPNTNGINSPVVSTLNNRRQQAGNINANSTLHNHQPSSINNGNRADSSFDLSYLTTAAGRWTQKATSLFGSMSGGLNQIIVTDIDIGEQQQPSRPTNSNSKPPKPIKSTSPVPGGKQQPIRQSMRTLMEEPDKQTANSQVKSRAQIKKIDQYEEEGQCFIMFDQSKARNNSNNKRTVRKQSSPQNVEIVVHDHEDEDDMDAEDEHIALYSPTTNFAYLNSCSSDGSSSSGSVQPITNRTTTGTPISNGCPSIPSSLSMPSSSNGSGDEDDDFKRQTGHHHLSATNHLPDWLQTGESVRISPDSKLGTIGYVGETRFASGLWVGVILDTPTGKNDGSVDGVQYFQCRPKFGIFVRPDKLKLDPKGRQMRQIGQQNHKSNINGRR